MTCICKLMDLVIIRRHGSMLQTTDMQFAFKKGHSTVLCTLMVKETVAYYTKRRSPVYGCLLDATKAFDRVKFDKLFQLLYARGLPGTALRLLLDMYTRQRARTEWAGHYSEYFDVTNGIRQGGIVSPLLFTVYMDELLTRLQAAGIGCYVGKEYCGSFAYADDLTLLSPTGSGLQIMLNVCEEFSEEFGVKFNLTKTVCIKFGSPEHADSSAILYGNILPWKHTVKHLGNMITSDLSEQVEITRKCCDFATRVNSVMGRFNTLAKQTRADLMNTFCCAFYGCEAWCLSDKALQSFQTAWNKAVRRVWGLPRTTHRYILPLLGSGLDFKQQIVKRFQNLVSRIESSDNDKVRDTMFILRGSQRSIIGRNLAVSRSMKNAPLTVEMVDTASVIVDLCNALDGVFAIDGLSYEEMTCMLESLCTN